MSVWDYSFDVLISFGSYFCAPGTQPHLQVPGVTGRMGNVF